MAELFLMNKPLRITFDTNPDICNLHCIMCDTHSIYNKNRKPKRGILPVEVIEKIVAWAVPDLKEIIPSTMGEPLLYPDFKYILKIAEKYKVKVNLTTNGTFPGLGVQKWAEKILPVASDVKISINAITPELNEKIMVGINHHKQIENIIKFVQIRDQIRKKRINNPTVTLQITFMEKNLSELPALLEFATKYNIDRIKGHHLWITWEQIKNQSLKRSTQAIERWNKTVDQLFALKKRLNSNVILDNFHKLAYGKQNAIPKEWICPFRGIEAWIDWDGTFNVCCAPDNMRKSFGYFGNVLETHFQQLWNGEKYRKFIRNWGKYKVCQNCNMRRPAEEVKQKILKLQNL